MLGKCYLLFRQFIKEEFIIKKRITCWLLFAFLFLVNVLFTNQVDASAGNFSISPLTEKGEFLQQGYYHFVGLPGAKKSASLELKNRTDKKIDIEIEINTAWTNKNGLPSYTSNKNKDSTLTYLIEELVNIEDTVVTIPANGEKIVPIIINYPKAKWEGQVLGGLRLHENNKKEEKKGVENEVAYTVGILLEMENTEQVDYQFRMNNVKANQRNYRNFIEVNLQNMAPKIIKDMIVQTYIYKGNQSKPVYELQSDSFRMAPNSNFDIGVPTGDMPVSPGNYHALLKVEVDNQIYEFSKDFVIEQETAHQLNQSAVNIVGNDNTVIYLIVTIIGLVALLYIIKQFMSRRTCSKLKN